MRRGMRHSHLLGSKEPVFYNLFETLRDEMSGNYPELVRADSLIKETLKMEEEKFLVLLDRGIKILNEEISKINKILPGEIAFKLYETYGFPIDLTEDILKSKSLKFDKERFGILMRESIELAKKNWKGSGDSAIEKIWYNVKEKNGTTEFLGYENNQSQGVIKCLLKSHKEVSILVEGDEAIIVVNQTPFYGESGGQVGDTGEIVADNFRFEVTDTQKKLGDLIVHYGKVTEGSIKLDDVVSLKINAERRKDMRAYHSATHLLHESLRRVLGDHVTQKGSLVEPSRLRFDFSHMKPIPTEEIDKIENFVNTMVSKKSDVKTRLMTPDEAVENGALALFGEKYGDEVRVLSMGDDGDKYFSTELCGGTHVKNTGDIGKFKIISQSSIAAGVRRIEALRDKQLEDYLNNKEKLSNLSSEKNDEIIKDLSEQIIKLGGKPSLDEDDQKTLIKNLSKQLETISVNSILDDKSKNIIQDEEINGIKLRLQKVDGLPPKELRKLVDKGKKELSDGIVIVFASKDEKVGIAVGVTDNLIEKFDAVNFVKVGSEIIGGQGGGGRKDFAQAGGQDQSKIDQAFEKLKTLI
jgi:alanyl-tRNA synthetase